MRHVLCRNQFCPRPLSFLLFFIFLFFLSKRRRSGIHFPKSSPRSGRTSNPGSSSFSLPSPPSHPPTIITTSHLVCYFFFVWIWICLFLSSPPALNELQGGCQEKTKRKRKQKTKFNSKLKSQNQYRNPAPNTQKHPKPK